MPECEPAVDRIGCSEPFRGGAPLILRSTIPSVLEYTPSKPKRKRRLPSEGRRLLTFY